MSRLTSACTLSMIVTQEVMEKVFSPTYEPLGAAIFTVAAITGLITLPLGTHIITSCETEMEPVPVPATPFASVYAI